MKKLICKLIGHLWNECAMDNGVNHCDRCGYSDAYGVKQTGEWTLRDELEHRLWRMKHWLRFRWDRVKSWFSKDNGTPF